TADPVAARRGPRRAARLRRGRRPSASTAFLRAAFAVRRRAEEGRTRAPGATRQAHFARRPRRAPRAPPPEHRAAPDRPERGAERRREHAQRSSRNSRAPSATSLGVRELGIARPTLMRRREDLLLGPVVRAREQVNLLVDVRGATRELF